MSYSLIDVTSNAMFVFDYTHPEISVSTTECTAFDCRYFYGESVVKQDVKSNYRAQNLVDMTICKRIVVDYDHLEYSVAITNPTSSGRNYSFILSIG